MPCFELEATSMRASSLVIASLLAGCGPVKLGEEKPGHAGPGEVQVAVGVALASCEGCFQLTAQASGGKAPYVFAWDDGADAGVRKICPADGLTSVTVTATDHNGVESVPSETSLQFPDASCPPPPELLCIKNPSFEGKPQFNDGSSGAFDGAPWKQCTNPPELNSPDIGNNTVQQPIATPPAATDGKTFLGMAENEQVSQKLCRPLEAGTVVSLKIDLQRLYVGAGVTPDTEKPFLEIWGGLSGDCSRRQLLWSSEPLGKVWKTYCVSLEPTEFMDQITLRASSDGSLPTTSYLLADHIVPVTSCP